MSLIETAVFQFNPEDFLDPPTNTVSHKAENRQRRKAEKASKGQSFHRPLVAKTPRQGEYLAFLNAGEDVFAVGGAGTGKTYIAARKAARALIEGRVERIIITRVTVSKAKHALGFLPGKLEQKLEPWLRPVFDGLKAEVSAQTLDQWRNENKIEIASFEHMRGRTFSNAFVLLDEAQNADLGDLKLFLTRIGENTQVVVTGDLDQIDVPNSGLNEVISIVEDYDIPMKVVRFTSSDVVRSLLAKAFVAAFENHSKGGFNLNSDVQILDTGHSLGQLPFMQAGKSLLPGE